MKRTCCFTTPRGMIIIISNMEFHAVGKRLKEMTCDTQIAAS